MKKLIARIASIVLLAGGVVVFTGTSASASDYQTLNVPCATTKRIAFEQYEGDPTNQYLYPCDIAHNYAGNIQKRVYVESGYDVKVTSPAGTYSNLFKSTGWHALPWWMNEVGEQGTAYQRGNGYFG